MDCPQAALKMQEFLDEALPAGEAELVRAHLTACAACSRAFKMLALVARALAGLPVYSLRPAARARIMAAWAAQRRRKARRVWGSAAMLALVSCGPALGLWLLDRNLTPRNGLVALDLLLDPDQALAMFRLQLAGMGVALGQRWSLAAAWLKPILLGITGGVVLTLVLFAVMVSAFLIISLVDRARPAPQLGRYL